MALYDIITGGHIVKVGANRANTSAVILANFGQHANFSQNKNKNGGKTFKIKWNKNLNSINDSKDSKKMSTKMLAYTCV